MSPLDLRGLFGDGLNLYGYVTNNPVSFNDPTGLALTNIKNSLVAVATAYAIGMDAIIVAQLEEGPGSSNIDVAIRVLPFMLQGALVGGLAGSSAVAGGITGLGTGLGFIRGALRGAVFDALFALGSAGVRAALGSAAAGLGKGFLGRVVRFRKGIGAQTRITGAQLTKLRKEFENRVRPAFWRHEAATNPGKYRLENLTRMRKGKAPLGEDGHTMELHHVIPLSEGGTNDFANLIPMTRNDHRIGDNFRKNHPK